LGLFDPPTLAEYNRNLERLLERIAQDVPADVPDVPASGTDVPDVPNVKESKEERINVKETIKNSIASDTSKSFFKQAVEANPTFRRVTGFFLRIQRFEFVKFYNASSFVWSKKVEVIRDKFKNFSKFFKK